MIQRLQAANAPLARLTITTLKTADSQLSADYLCRFLARPENFLIVATAEDQPLGYLVAYLLDRVDRDQRMMLFYEISVAAAHQRRGVGTAMIKRLQTFCRQENVMKMWVHTNKSNVAAMKLYQATGGTADRSGDEISFLYLPEWPNN